MAALRRLLTGLKWTLIGLFLLLVIMLAVPAGLLGTTSGITWLLGLADGQIPGELRVETVTGNLFGDLRLEGVHYSDPAMRLELGSVILSWKPGELLQRRLHIVQLNVAAGRFEQLQPGEQEPSEPLTLHDVEFPLAIALDQVTLDGFTVVNAPEAEPLVLERARLQAKAENSEITLEQLELVLRDLVALQADGRLQLAGEWPLVLNNAVQLKLPELPGFALDGQISGDLLRLLKLQQTLSGGADVQLDAEIQEPLGQLGWKGDLTLTQLSDAVRELAGVTLPARLNAKLSGTGDLAQADAKIQLRLGRPLPAGDADSSAEKAPESGETVVALNGTLRFEELQFQAKGEWQGVQWPLAGAPPLVITESGGLEIEGGIDDYRFDLQARIEGPDIPPGAWNARGSGSTEKVRIDTLKGEVLGGELQAQGAVAWSPRVEWDAQLSGSGIDPAHYAPEWPGSLAFRLGSSGSIEEQGLRLGAVIEQLEGKLRDLPVAGSGEFHMDGAEMTFQQIRLSSGKAQLQADGRLQEQWDLDWSIDVATLADILPGASGSVQGSGKLTGSAGLPNVQAQLTAKGLRFQELQAQQLEADVDLRLDAAQGGKEVADIKLKASGVGNADNALETLNLEVGGPLSAQTIRLDAVHTMGAVKLAADGALDLGDTRWQGKLSRLDLDARQWGKWGLQSPATISASPDAVTASKLCLREGGTALCAEADWIPGGGSAKATLDGFSFKRLKSLLPKQMVGLKGGLDAKVDATLGPQLGADLVLNLEPGQVTYLVDEARQVRLTYQGGGLKATYDQKALAAKLKLKMQQSDIAAQLNVPRDALDNNPLAAPLQGGLDFNFQQLGLVTAFVPAVRQSEGLIHGKLKLGGVLGEPKVGGKIVLDMSALVIPDAGLDLKDLKVVLSGDGKRLRFSGGASSGPGRLKLGGGVELNADKGWPAELTIKGDRFQAVALPEAVVFVSPDLKVKHGRQGLQVQGSVTIPETAIELRELPTTARTVSSDLVIVENNDDDQGQQSGLPIDAKVTVILGKKVRFSGFGLEADLGGRLTVTQAPGSRPVGNGEFGIVRGSYRFLGQALDIERGKLFYAGGNLNNPGLNVEASRQLDDIKVGILVTGTAKNPKIKAYSSDPGMSERDARSLLLTGTTQGSGTSASVYAGTHVTDRLSVGTNMSVDGSEREFVARYKINRKLSLKTTSSSSTSGGELLYTIEFK